MGPLNEKGVTPTARFGVAYDHIDLLTLSVSRVRIRKAVNCPDHASNRVVRPVTTAGLHAAEAASSEAIEVQFDSIDEAEAQGYRIVDIREPMECAFEPLPVAGQQSMPLGRLLDGALAVEAGHPYLLVCAHGVRSHAAAEFLRARGHSNVWSLAGGLAAQE